MFVVIRGRGTSDALGAALRDTIRGLDPHLAVANLQPLAETVSASAAPQRFAMLLMTAFAGIALLLAMIGIYGVVAYAVAQRTHEIGVRMALGADAAAVVQMMVRSGAALALLGVAIGAAAAAALAPTLKALLFGVKPLDAPSFISAGLVLLIVAIAATYLPARRATRVDPLIAIRSE